MSSVRAGRAWRGPASLLAIATWCAPVVGGHAQVAPPASPPAASAPAPLVLPGDSTVRGSRIAAGTVRYALTAYRDADEIPVGRLADEIRIDTVPGAVLLRRVQRLQRGTMELIDSTRTDFATLAPRWHRSLQATRRAVLEFGGRRVKGSVGPNDVPPVPIDTTLPVPVFDSGNWDLLVRALPLEKGFTARFPVYDPDAGLREYHVAVTGSTTVQGEEAYVVLFTLGKGRESVVWIGKQSHDLLQMETMLGPTALLRQVRVR
ncbi:MAG: hypothetical protein ACK5ZZ_12835 [Gemmatimonadaceae bacterium]|jgi:hypothetical protein